MHAWTKMLEGRLCAAGARARPAPPSPAPMHTHAHIHTRARPPPGAQEYTFAMEVRLGSYRSGATAPPAAIVAQAAMAADPR